MQRFLASDVIYEDSFAGPATQALKKDDITGIEVPPAAGVPAERRPSPRPRAPRASSPTSSGASRQSGDAGTTQSGNLRGMSLESTVAKPSDTRLTPGETGQRPVDRAASSGRSP